MRAASAPAILAAAMTSASSRQDLKGMCQGAFLRGSNVENRSERGSRGLDTCTHVAPPSLRTDCGLFTARDKSQSRTSHP